MSKTILEKNTQNNIPRGWVRTTLEEISMNLQSGGTPLTKQKEFYENGTIPFVKIEDITNSKKYLYDTKIKITENGLKNSTAWLVPENSLLYTMYASYGIPIINKINVATSQAIIAYIPPQKLISIDFIYYYLLYIKRKLIPKGTTQGNLNASIIKTLQILLSPLSEQKRIVSKIEELMSKLDFNEKILELIKRQISNYEKALLKSAFGGKLILNEKITPNNQNGSDLLKEILHIRYQNWEHFQLNKYDKTGKNPPKNWIEKYIEPEVPSITFLENIPENWCWATADQLTSRITDGEHITPSRTSEGVYLLSARNIRDGYLAFDDVDFISEHTFEKLSQRLTMNEGDVLLSCSGSVGRSCVVPKELKFSMVRSVAVLKPVKNMGEFLSYAIRSPLLQNQINEKKTQTAQSNIFQEKIRKLVFPLPSMTEQSMIVNILTNNFSKINEIKQILNTLWTKNHMLRYVILKQAFEGRLVPQNPNDEPAEILLQKIRKEKEKLRETQKVIRATSIKTRRIKNAK